MAPNNKVRYNDHLLFAGGSAPITECAQSNMPIYLKDISSAKTILVDNVNFYSSGKVLSNRLYNLPEIYNVQENSQLDEFDSHISSPTFNSKNLPVINPLHLYSPPVNLVNEKPSDPTLSPVIYNKKGKLRQFKENTDFSAPLNVETTVEYDLPAHIYPPKNAAPILMLDPKYTSPVKHNYMNVYNSPKSSPSDVPFGSLYEMLFAKKIEEDRRKQYLLVGKCTRSCCNLPMYPPSAVLRNSGKSSSPKIRGRPRRGLSVINSNTGEFNGTIASRSLIMSKSATTSMHQRSRSNINASSYVPVITPVQYSQVPSKKSVIDVDMYATPCRDSGISSCSGLSVASLAKSYDRISVGSDSGFYTENDMSPPDVIMEPIVQKAKKISPIMMNTRMKMSQQFNPALSEKRSPSFCNTALSEKRSPPFSNTLSEKRSPPVFDYNNSINSPVSSTYSHLPESYFLNLVSCR